jgi:general secretion pathway protein M
VLGAVIAIAVYVAVAMAVDRDRRAIATRVSILTAQAAAVDSHAAEIERLRSAPQPVQSRDDLRSVLEIEARASGVARMPVKIVARSADEAEVAVAAAPFADWLAWVAALQRQQVRVETCRIEALATPGLVNATATFVRAR